MRFSFSQDDLETSALALQSLLKTLIELADIYLIFCAQTDEDEQQILARIHILYREFPAHRCLFFSSSIGKVAIIRQVIPSLLIDHDRTFCDKLKPHVKRIIWVDSSISTSSADIVGPVQRGQLNTESTYPTVDKCGSEGSASNTAPPSGSAVGFPTVQSLNDILNIS